MKLAPVDLPFLPPPEPRRRPRRLQPEAAIQRAIFEHLRLRAMPGVVYWHTPNGGYRRPVEAALLQAMGVQPGIPDVLLLKAGRLYALELKAPRRKPTLIQVEVMARLAQAGATVTCTSDLDIALLWLADHGLIRRVSVSPRA